MLYHKLISTALKWLVEQGRCGMQQNIRVNWSEGLSDKQGGLVGLSVWQCVRISQLLTLPPFEKAREKVGL